MWPGRCASQAVTDPGGDEELAGHKQVALTAVGAEWRLRRPGPGGHRAARFAVGG